MKKIKSFKLFEAGEVDPYAQMWEIFEDIKSIEYIVEEAGYRILYEFLFKGKTKPGYREKINKVLFESSVRSMMENNIPLGEFCGFRIEVAYPKDQVMVNAGGQIFLTPEQIEKLGIDTERYCSLLRDHLDYVSSVERHSGGTGKNIVIVKL